MGKYIAVEGLQLEIVEGGATNSNGTAQVHSSTVPSNFDKAGGAKAYAGTLMVEVSAFTSSLVPNWIPASGSSPAPGSIISTCLKAKAKEGAFFLEGDQAPAVAITGKITTQSGPVEAATTVSVKIKSAGQNVVKAT